jgi:ribonuclease R
MRGRIYYRTTSKAQFSPDWQDPPTAKVAAELGLERETRYAVDESMLGTALNGDFVSVKAARTKPPSWWRHVPEKKALLKKLGKADSLILQLTEVKVLERSPGGLPGTFHLKNQFAWVTPTDTNLPRKIEILPGEVQARSGDAVVFRIEKWSHATRMPQARLIERLGKPTDVGVDILGIIHRFGLPLHFSADVEAEAASLPPEPTAEDLHGREDWRDKPVFTIDPTDARDFDDAIAVKRLPKGAWELAVHIADVSHYVRPGTAMDAEARRRGNSVYLADRVIPMLPEKLSNGLCSLRPNEVKLTRLAVLTFDAKGRRTGARFAKAVIRSRQRFTYEQAFAAMKPYLKNPEAGWQAAEENLPAQAWTLAALLRQRRLENGALDLEMPEVRAVLDAKGKPIALQRSEYDESHQLIEEFMLAANQAVAEQLVQSGKPGIYRAHEDPEPERLQQLRETLGACGIRVGDLTVRRSLQQALAAILGRPDSHALKLAVLKSMKRAAYSAECTGHYGLAMPNYTHFTSPIRRYADLIVHRLQARLIFGEKLTLPGISTIQDIAEHISDTERNAAEAEQESRKLKQMEYFRNLIASGAKVSFPAVVTDVHRAGLFIEMTDVMARGIVRRENLKTVRFEAQGKIFISKKPKKIYQVGTVLQVVPVEVEADRGSIACRLA